MVIVKLLAAVLFFANVDLQIGEATVTVQLYRIVWLLFVHEAMTANYQGFFVTIETLSDLTADLAVLATAIAAMISADSINLDETALLPPIVAITSFLLLGVRKYEVEGRKDRVLTRFVEGFSQIGWLACIAVVAIFQ